MDGQLDEMIIRTQALQDTPLEVGLGPGQPVALPALALDMMEDQVGDEPPVYDGQRGIGELILDWLGQHLFGIGARSDDQIRQKARPKNHQSHDAELRVARLPATTGRSAKDGLVFWRVGDSQWGAIDSVDFQPAPPVLLRRESRPVPGCLCKRHRRWLISQAIASLDHSSPRDNSTT